MADFSSSAGDSDEKRIDRPNPGMRALEIHPQSPETFFHDATPVDNRAGNIIGDSTGLQDSHDLSLHRTRDSVVDNMLLSLDQFSQPTTTLYSRFGDDFFIADSSHETLPKASRQRGHTYTSSHSSDYGPHVDDTASRYRDHHSHSRSRRSYSDNNITGSASRKQLFGDQQQGRHSRMKGSKSSGSSSMDIGHGMVIGKHTWGGMGHAASFDHGNKTSRTSPVKAESILHRSKPAYQNYPDEYDAAPEPTIPAGPRRHQEVPQSSAAYPPQPSYPAPQAPAPRRKGSIRSTTSYKTLRRLKSQPEPSMRDQAQEFVNASHLRDLPPLPTFEDSSAPSPTVATRKNTLPTFAPPASMPPSKEKQPGFFRRVFGGGLPKVPSQLSNSSATSASSRLHAEPSPASSHHRPAEVDSVYSSQTRPRTTPTGGSHHIASQLKSPPSRDAQPAASMHDLKQQPVPPVLSKKGSSFFRRRKKSVAEPPVPAMLLDFTTPTKAEIPNDVSSPSVSSLRQVMNPYLNDVEGPTAGKSNRERSNGFSPGYKPHKDAVVRAVEPSSHATGVLPTNPRDEQLNAALLESPKLKLKVKRGRAEVVQEDTFLADSSSCNEDRNDYTQASREYNITRDGGEKPADLLSLLPGDARAAPAVSPSQSASSRVDDDWVLPTTQASTKQTTGRSQRVWLTPTSSEENLAEKLTLPLEGARMFQNPIEKELLTPITSPSSTDDVFHSATSLPTVQVEGHETTEINMPAIVENRHRPDEPTDADRKHAKRIFSGVDPSIPKDQAATILGDCTPASSRLRMAFMHLFDWTGFNILGAMRDLCGKIVLKAETQQVDRILMSLSARWCECNNDHGFRAVDVVHTICYSILLLNTDLHVADIESRMTRSQFVKNTLPTVSRVCIDAVNDAADETLRPQSTQFKRGSIPWTNKSEPNSPPAEETAFPAEVKEEPLENKRARSRLSLRPPFRSGSEGMSAESAFSEANLLVHAPYNGPMKGWESQVEIVLREFYDSIRKTRLPLHGAPKPQVHEQPSSNNLSVSGMLRRTPSVLSKAPSDNASYRGRSQMDFRNTGKSWNNSKTRSRPRLYPTSTIGSSRTSLDDQSVWSPTGSSSWSKYSHGKTQTTMSMESLGSRFAHGDYQQAIGFANALSQAIIREEGMPVSNDEEFTRVAPLLEDETLELVGAPWAKEGILKHKHHLESLGKKAKDRTWNECFAVIEKGYFRLFSFNMNSKSMRLKNKSRPSAGGVVGGGNWMDNAEALDSILLRQTIASALPPPGYSKSRPHVFALSLPTGAVHLFQVGTPDIAREFVTTANYWSARLSKEPLMGGVSNAEHGWGENVINKALIRPQDTMSRHEHGHMNRPSMASSMRSSMDHATGTVKARLAGDKVSLSDWRPPVQSMMASNLMEVDQLRALTDYVKNVEEELSRHNELRAPMLIAFSPRHPNAAKAMANWECKSSYLLREIVKFRTYIDSLTAAQTQKDKIYAQREAEEEARTSMEAGDHVPSSPIKENDGASEVPQTSVPITA